jgi:hypothetical protein
MGLSREVMEKWVRRRPRTISEAGRSPGVTPAAVNVILTVTDTQTGTIQTHTNPTGLPSSRSRTRTPSRPVRSRDAIAKKGERHDALTASSS